MSLSGFNLSSRSWLAAGSGLLAACIIGLWFLIVLTYGVDIPRHDQWDTPAAAIINSFNGTFELKDLYRQHNESRKVLPTAISVFLARAQGYYDTRYELLVGWLLRLSVVGLLLFHALRTFRGSFVMPVVLAMFSAATLFSANTIWAHLWSITFERLLPELFLLINLVLLSYLRLSWRLVFVLALTAFVAQYSYAGGVVVWPLTILMLILRRPWDGSAVWAKASVLSAIWLVSIFAYFWSYTANPGHSSLLSILDQPVSAILEFFLVFLGAPYSIDRGLAFLFGALGASVFLACILTVASRWARGTASKALVSWAVLGLWSLSQAALATLSRLSMSPDHAMRTDYMSHSLYLWVSGLVLLAMILDRSPKLRSIPTAIAVALGLALSVGLTSSHFWQSLASFNAQFAYAKVCYIYRGQHLDSDCLALLTDNIDKMRVVAQKADGAGLIKPGVLRGLSQGHPRVGGAITEVRRVDDGWKVRGWVLLEKGAGPGAILVGMSDEGRLSQVLAFGRIDDRRGFWARLFPWHETLVDWEVELEDFDLDRAPPSGELDAYFVLPDTGAPYLLKASSVDIGWSSSSR
jgi:hypothetical protein